MLCCMLRCETWWPAPAGSNAYWEYREIGCVLNSICIISGLLRFRMGNLFRGQLWNADPKIMDGSAPKVNQILPIRDKGILQSEWPTGKFRIKRKKRSLVFTYNSPLYYIPMWSQVTKIPTVMELDFRVSPFQLQLHNLKAGPWPKAFKISICYSIYLFYVINTTQDMKKP